MTSFSVGANNGFLLNRKNNHLRRQRTLCCSYSVPCRSSISFPTLGFRNCYKSQHGLLYNNRIRLLAIESCGNIHAHLGKRENRDLNKRFRLRLRPRLWLLSGRLKRGSIRSMVNEFGAFLRKNIKGVTLTTAISVALGMCYLFLKLTAVPSPRIVPYSDLITSLQSGAVTNVLFEEGSRRIYYNIEPQCLENAQTSGETLPVDVPNENLGDGISIKDVARIHQGKGVNALRRFSRNQASAPEWQYSTRKIDRDENFLLSLMREKGTTYSSAPQSVLMSMRSILMTILSLWIPLTPLMWLLYRQLSAANSPARKRRPSSQIVSFDDVEGVDAAKVELMEVRYFLCQKLLCILCLLCVPC